MTAQLPQETESAEVPQDAGAIGTSAHGHVVRVGGAQARDRLCVAEERHFEVKRPFRSTLAVLPHINHLQQTLAVILQESRID